VTILALHHGKLSVVTTYMLLGGLILPFLWGIIAYGEALTVTKAIGVVVLMLSMASSLLLDMKNGKSMEDEKLPANDGAIILVDRNAVGMSDVKDVIDKCAYFNTPLIGVVYAD
jgi:hypothetical protein